MPTTVLQRGYDLVMTAGNRTVIPPKRSRRGGQLAAALLLIGVLGGCSSVVENVPSALGGLPEGVPARSAGPAAYPAVHDMPPSRQDSALTEAERKRLRDELNATRKRVMAPETAGSGRAAGGAPNP
jgi:hypothetical protein